MRTQNNPRFIWAKCFGQRIPQFSYQLNMVGFSCFKYDVAALNIRCNVLEFAFLKTRCETRHFDNFPASHIKAAEKSEMRNAVRSLAALLRSRPLQPASPDLAERIIRKAKHIRQRTNQTAIKLGC